MSFKITQSDYKKALRSIANDRLKKDKLEKERIVLNIKHAREKYKLKPDLPKCVIDEIYKRIDNNQLEDFTPEGLEDIYNQLIPPKVRWGTG